MAVKLTRIRVAYSGLVSLTVVLLSVLIGLVFTIVVTRTLNPTEYGTWGLMGGLIAYSTILEPAISYWALRESARGIESGKTAVLSTALLSVGGIIIYIVAAFLVGHKITIDRTAVFFGAILIPTIYLNRVLTSINLGWKPNAASYGQIFFVIAEIVMGLIFVRFLHLGVYGIVVSVFLGYLVSNSVLAWYAKDKIKNRVKKIFLKKWLRLSWIQLYQTISTVLLSFDVTIFSIITGSVVGLAYWTATAVITNFVKNTSAIVFPAQSKLLQEGNTGHLRETLTQYIYVSILFASLTITFSKQALFILNPIYEITVPVVVIMSLQAFFLNISGAILGFITGIEKVDIDERSTLKDYFKSKLVLVPTFMLIQSVVYVAMLTIGITLLASNSSQLELLIYWSIIALISQIPFTIYSIVLLKKHLDITLDIVSIAKYLLSSSLSFGLAYVLMEKFLAYKTNVFEFIPNLLIFVGVGVGAYLVITYLIDQRTKILFKAILREIKSRNS